MITRTPAGVGLGDQALEVADGAELVQDGVVVGDVVAAVAQRRLEERRQPQAVDPQPLEVVELVDQAGEVPGAVTVGVREGPDEHLVEDGLAVPVRVVLQARCVQVKGAWG